MPTYAKSTSVNADRSWAEIERTLKRYGANAFMYGWDNNQSIIGFEIADRRFRIRLAMPVRSDFNLTGTGRMRTSESASDAYEQAVRQRWRAMALWIKATLEAAEAGITTIQEALQPFTVLPNGRTVGEWMAPQIETAYENRQMPPMLPDGNDATR